jgi:hypothetical protein
MNIKFRNSNSHMYVSHFCTCLCILIEGLHPSHHPNLEYKIFSSYPNLITSALWPLDLLKFCWNDDIFLPTPSLRKWASAGKWPIKTKVDDSELKCPQHMGGMKNPIHWNAPWGDGGLYTIGGRGHVVHKTMCKWWIELFLEYWHHVTGTNSTFIWSIV